MWKGGGRMRGAGGEEQMKSEKRQFHELLNDWTADYTQLSYHSYDKQ